MRVLFCGDIVGRTGRDALAKHLPSLKETYKIDWVVVNGENAAAGYGITPSICVDLFELQVDVITTGNHAWDQRQIVDYIKIEPRLLRPINYPKATPGNGIGCFKKEGVRDLVVANVMTRLFMEPLDDPFATVFEALKPYKMGQNKLGGIVVDAHGEASSEKAALGYSLDGTVSLVTGTHTHVPTSDTRILPSGTAFQTDAGMCGDYNSVIGMEKDIAIKKFTSKLPSGRLSPATGEGTVSGMLVEVGENGLALHVEPVIIGGALKQRLPTFCDRPL